MKTLMSLLLSVVIVAALFLMMRWMIADDSTKIVVPDPPTSVDIVRIKRDETPPQRPITPPVEPEPPRRLRA